VSDEIKYPELNPPSTEIGGAVPTRDTLLRLLYRPKVGVDPAVLAMNLRPPVRWSEVMPDPKPRTFIQLTRAWYAKRELKEAKFVEEFNLSSTDNEFQIRWYDFSALEGRTPLRMEIVVWYDTLRVYEDFGDLFIALLEWRKSHKRNEPPQPRDVLVMLQRLSIADGTPLKRVTTAA